MNTMNIMKKITLSLCFISLLLAGCGGGDKEGRQYGEAVSYDIAPVSYYTVPASYYASVAIPAGKAAPTAGPYSISPALPTGLSFNTATGEISGTPSSVHDAEYTVSSAGGASTRITIKISPAPAALSAGSNDIIAAGAYLIPAGAATVATTINIKTTEPVTLIGDGFEGTNYVKLTINCDAGSDLTIQDLFVSRNEAGIIKFNGLGNTLRLSGTNLLESPGGYSTLSVIHAGKGSALTITGPGILYMYRTSMGSGIGGDGYESCGEITIAGGFLYLKGTKTGVCIGGDDIGDGTKGPPTVNDDIYITGGVLNIEANGPGSAIGASRLGICAGNVYISGGTVTITCNYTGSAIGYGAEKKGSAGKVYITGGSLKTVRTGNSMYCGGYSEYEGEEYAELETEHQVAVDSLITAEKLNGNGVPVERLVFDTSLLPAGTNEFSTFLHVTKWTKDTALTVDNWTTSDDKSLYFYLTKENHKLTVNGIVFDAIWNGTYFVIEK
jgi:hypothetical protein